MKLQVSSISSFIVLRESRFSAGMLLVQLRVSIEATDTSTSIGIAILETHIPEEESEEGIGLDILDAQFFDDESMVIVYRLPAGESKST